MCQYTHIHHMGKESEDFVMQKGTTSAPPEGGTASPTKGLTIHPHG